MSELQSQMNELSPTLGPLITGEVDSPRSAINRIADLGFHFIQLSGTHPGLRPRDLDRSARRDLLATLRRRELSASGIDLWIPASHFLDESHIDRATEAVIAAIELASELGRLPISLWLPAESKAIDEIVRHAQRFDIELVDHTVPVTIREGMTVGIDPAAWLSNGDDPVTAINEHASRIGCVRLCDLLTSGLRGPIGNHQEGQLNVMEYKVAVSISEYSRPIVIDTRQWNNSWKGLEQSRRVWCALP